MRDSYAAKALALYGLPLTTFIYIFGVINSINIALISRNIIYIIVLISARMIFVKSSKSLKSSSLFLSLSISRTATKLKNVVFSIYSYLFAYSGVVVSLFRRGASALAPYSGLYRLYFKPYFPLSTHISADMLLLRCMYSM
jgi:hypothetical protein